MQCETQFPFQWTGCVAPKEETGSGRSIYRCARRFGALAHVIVSTVIELLRSSVKSGYRTLSANSNRSGFFSIFGRHSRFTEKEVHFETAQLSFSSSNPRPSLRPKSTGVVDNFVVVVPPLFLAVLPLFVVASRLRRRCPHLRRRCPAVTVLPSPSLSRLHGH